MKTVKKALTAFLAVFLLISVIPFTAYASDYQIQNIYGESLSDNNVKVMSDNVGNGEEMNFTPAIAGRVERVTVYVTFKISQAKQGDNITLSASLYSPQLSNMGGFVRISSNEYFKADNANFSNGKCSITAKALTDVQDKMLSMEIWVKTFTVNDGYSDVDLTLRCNASSERISETTGLLNSIIEFVKGIFENIKELPNKIGDFFNNLIDKLSTWFTNLTDSISGFFTDIKDNINGFFEKLWNRIYWGNENGESEYQKPSFGENFTKMLDKLEAYVNQLKQVQGNISDSKTEAVGYLTQGTTLINSVMGVFPSVLTAFVSFGLAFIFCRKVVGR